MASRSVQPAPPALGARGPRLLLLLLLLSWPPPGGALGLAGLPGSGSGVQSELGPGSPDSDPDTAGVQEFRKRYEDLMARLRVNQSWEDSNLGPDPAVRIITPQVRVESHGRLLVRVPRASVTQGVPESYSVHRALLRLSPTTSRDVTRPLLRQLRLPGPTLQLRVSPRGAAVAAVRELEPELELHLRARAGRGRRSARPRDECPLGPGRCCRLLSVRASLEDLGWAGSVLSPRELQVTVCAGECPSRFRAASTHAQVKARLHRLRPDVVPGPCCVPAAYEPVVLLQRADGGLALRTYDDLLATSCHCA